MSIGIGMSCMYCEGICTKECLKENKTTKKSTYKSKLSTYHPKNSIVLVFKDGSEFLLKDNKYYYRQKRTRYDYWVQGEGTFTYDESEVIRKFDSTIQI